MRNLFLTLVIPILSFGQINSLQTFGTVTHFLVSCPCKLLKYYESGELYYYCKDETLQTTYMIKEIKHKDGLDLILTALDKNIYSFALICRRVICHVAIATKNISII